MTFEQLATGQIVFWPGSIVVHESPIEHVTMWTDASAGEPRHSTDFSGPDVAARRDRINPGANAPQLEGGTCPTS